MKASSSSTLEKLTRRRAACSYTFPPASADGDYEYEGQIVYSFASDAIFQLLMKQYNDQMLAGAMRLFNVRAAPETSGFVSVGVLFEKTCLWLKPLDGRRITAFSFSGGDNVTFSVPGERFLLSHDWKETVQLSANNCREVTPCEGQRVA